MPVVAALSERRPLDIVSLISSRPDSSFPDFVGDLDAILSRNHLRLLPILGRGPLHTVNDLLYTPGIDIAVVQADAIGALDHPARRRLRYIAKVYDEQFHVVAGREITDIRQLDGRKVNIDGPGTGTYLTARNVFKRLKVTPEFTTDDQATSYRKLSAGEIAAAVYVAPGPARELGAFAKDSRFHLVPVKYGDEIAGDYLPSEFDPSHYPSLIESGTRVETIAVTNVLAVLNWPERSERYRRLARFVSAFFSRYDSSLMHDHRSKWDEGIPSARVPGWQRFRPAQEWLDQKALGSSSQDGQSGRRSLLRSVRPSAAVTLGIVSAQPTAAADPCERALHDPAFGSTTNRGRSQRRMIWRCQGTVPRFDLAALATGVADNALDKGKAPSRLSEQSLRAITILDARGMDVDGQQQAERGGKKVSLAT